MKYIDEFREKSIVKNLADQIAGFSDRNINLMEVCGTHTMAIFRSGIKQLLPKNINLISGPGCPVCVTSQSDIDCMLELASTKNLIITTFGDMLKVPGTKSSLEKIRSDGADIRVVYSPLDALEIAKENKNKEVVFWAVGFETTSPVIASVVDDTRKLKLRNFSVYCCHKLIPPAMAALLASREIKIHGFLCPGHVSSIIGTKAYQFIAQEFKIPCVVSGFEPTDILETILMLLKQIAKNTASVEIQYKRAVHPQGNIPAQEMLKRVFLPCDADWRGLGTIPQSGLKLNSDYAGFDARSKFQLKTKKAFEPKNCLCGEVLRGVKTPAQCKLFAKICNPENPFGPCMVSSEGTCSAWYKYNR
ncbi:MAG: hydrogenase formation protein HypD [Candidatus Omnitrophica bacterium]|nr:hydrogenase formation protein HypD [Candidatus Omnitrophota bacterium]